MLDRRAVAFALALVVAVPLAGCAARGSFDDLLRAFSKGETLPDDALRTIQATAKELADSDEAVLVCTASTQVAGVAVDSWNPLLTQQSLAAQPATTEAGTILREYVDNAVANPAVKSGMKGSIDAFDAAFC